MKLAKWTRGVTAGAMLWTAALAGASAQTAAPQSPTPSASPTAGATPASTPTPPAASTPSPAASALPSPSPSPTSESAAAGQSLVLAEQPAAFMEGKASHDDVYAVIQGAFATLRAEVVKAGLKPTGRPVAVFLEADDSGFKYRAEIPIEAAPSGKTQLTDSIRLGSTPGGKAMRFEHRGAYDDIDATYEAITAFLDEKGIDAEDIFVEQYLNEVKTSDDPNLQVDIFVLLK